MRRWETVFADEVQDANPINRQMIVSSGQRVVAVGDPHQSVFQYRGADLDSMRLLEEMANCHRLPLNA
jgi:superfamily I DNA/RNA helicase